MFFWVPRGCCFNFPFLSGTMESLMPIDTDVLIGSPTDDEHFLNPVLSAWSTVTWSVVVPPKSGPPPPSSPTPLPRRPLQVQPFVESSTQKNCGTHFLLPMNAAPPLILACGPACLTQASRGLSMGFVVSNECGLHGCVVCKGTSFASACSREGLRHFCLPFSFWSARHVSCELHDGVDLIGRLRLCFSNWQQPVHPQHRTRQM